MPIGRVLVVCLVFGIIACDKQLPVAPIPDSTAITTSAPSEPQFYGVVRDTHGNPIAGARVTFWPSAGERLTDAYGQFSFPRSLPVESVLGSKPGYESASRYVEAGIELTLHNIIRIPVGESARLTIGQMDSPGGMPPEPYRTRIVRVMSSEHVTASIQVVADDGAPAEYWIQDNCGDICPRRSTPSTFTVTAGGEQHVWIRTPNVSGDRSFTVTTSRAE